MTGVFLYNVFFLTGLQTIMASRASVIVASNPVFISLFAALLFREERLTPVKIIGIALSVSGAVYVISRGNPMDILQGALGRGEVLIFGCVLSWVSYSLIGKVVMKDVLPVSAVTYACLFGAAALLPPALFEGMAGDLGRYSMPAWLSIVYLGFFRHLPRVCLVLRGDPADRPVEIGGVHQLRAHQRRHHGLLPARGDHRCVASHRRCTGSLRYLPDEPAFEKRLLNPETLLCPPAWKG